MKKLFIACVMSLSTFTMAAQEASGALSFTASEMYGTDENIVVTARYEEANPGTTVVVDHHWELRPVDEDGVVGEPIFSQEYEGDPTGDFIFPESVKDNMIEENDYQITLNATDSWGNLLFAYPFTFAWTNYVLTAPTEICCGNPITVNGSFTGDVLIGIDMTYQWTVTMCDAQGNSTWPLSYYDSGLLQGFPYGNFTVPNSGQPYPTGVKCDQHYRIDLIFKPDPQHDRQPVTRSVIVYMTSFMLTTNATYCSGQFIYATGKYCQGTNSPPVFNRQWKIFNSDAAGNILSGCLIPVIPLGGAPNGTSEVVMFTNNLPPGWYVLQLDFLDGSNVVQGSRTKLIYINQSPTAAITGGVTCGVGGFNATPTGTNYTYQWSAFNGNTPFTSPFSAYGNACSVGPGAFNKVKVIVTDQNGCSSQAITTFPTPGPPPITGNFNITFTSTGANEYYITINRAGSYSLNGVYDSFSVMDIANGNLSWKPCWTSSTPTWGSNILFSGFDGASYMGFPASPNVCPGTMYPTGRFYKDKTYYIEHYLTYNGCSYPVHKYFNWTQGVTSCWGCRTGEEGSMESGIETSTTFDVFPNPSNGAFTLLLNGEAVNAQAELVNVLGEHVDAFTFSGSSYSYAPAQMLAPGIYLLRLTNNGAQFTKRIMIE